MIINSAPTVQVCKFDLKCINYKVIELVIYCKITIVTKTSRVNSACFEVPLIWNYYLFFLRHIYHH